ncbi:MAG: hypothetical protein ABS36_16860 [Acidobacteria bacterium SCN 69-37]|nr:MAG: hypothetical protein ABS36_16860 [Acidobacteria bacterium SCN 69-37]
MTARFRPRLDVLPASQRALWPALRDLKTLGWVLYGGTAVSLRLGHRVSVDFDFFSSQPLDRMALADACPSLRTATVLQERPDTLTVLMHASGAPDRSAVKVSFFAGIDCGRVAGPDLTDDDVLCVASADDLLAHKVKVLLQRVEAKDYLDIAALVESGVHLDRALAAARLMFGSAFQPSESLKALAFFEGGDLDTLPARTRQTLIAAAAAVRDLPRVPLIAGDLCAISGPDRLDS